jgi:hypothetical protein
MMKAMEEMRNREVKANTMIAELKGRVRELEAVSIKINLNGALPIVGI